MALPTNVEFCEVTGRFLRAVLDSTDPDRDPEGVPLEGLRVTFTAGISPALVRNVSAVPPVMIVVDPIVVFTDADGVLVDADGTAGVFLVASDDPDLDPSGWTYSVDVRNTAGATITRFSFVAPSGGSVDLATVVPVPASPGEDLPAWVAAVAETEENVAEAEAAASAAAGSSSAAAGSASAASGSAGTAGTAAGSAQTAASAAGSSATAADSSADAAAQSAVDAAAAIAGWNPLAQPVLNAGKLGVNAPAPSQLLEVVSPTAGVEPHALVRVKDATANIRAVVDLEGTNGAGTLVRHQLAASADQLQAIVSNAGIGGQQFFVIRIGASEAIRFTFSTIRFNGSTGTVIQLGSGVPEGSVTATPGSLYLRTAGGTGTTFYVKETGTGNTGWVAK